MPFRLLRRSFAGLIAASAAFAISGSAAAAQDYADDQFMDDTVMPTSGTTFGGASPLETTRTVQHWAGRTTNPADGVTYSYNMVGVDPNTTSGAGIAVDIIPLDVNVAGGSFNGSDAVTGVLSSPLFQDGDYSTTPMATSTTGGRQPGGALSAGNTGVQLLDATMRAEFNKVGTGYHLILLPAVHDPVNIDIPSDQGTTLTSPVGITYADIDVHWFGTRVQNELKRLQLDPTHLSLFLTKNLVLFADGIPTHCCVIGAHGAGSVFSPTNGSANGSGDQPVHTFVWSSWLTAGFYNPRKSWAKQDIHGLSHELAEWANDPFVNNTVQPWFSPIAPQYGCSNLLETGDPVIGIGFSQGTNPYFQNAFTDGTYHPEDEALLPWFMRSSPNDISQPKQSDPTAGRYTFMGDLNPFAFFQHPPATC